MANKNYLNLNLNTAVRNNNPGNIKAAGGKPYQGQVGVSGQFVQFKDVLSGTRALIKTVAQFMASTKNGGYGLNTVALFLSRYAPSSENNTNAYVRAMCAYTGFEKDQVLKVNKSNVLSIAGYISIHEGFSVTKADASGLDSFADINPFKGLTKDELEAGWAEFYKVESYRKYLDSDSKELEASKVEDKVDEDKLATTDVRSAKLEGYFTYIHTNGQYTKLDDIIVNLNKWKEDGKTYVSSETILNDQGNRASVRASYTSFDNVPQGQEASKINVGTVLRIKTSYLQSVNQLLTYNSYVYPTSSFAAFIPDQLRQLFENSGYVEKYKLSKGGPVQSVEKRHLAISVWFWCKAGGSNKNGGFINATPFVISLNTSQTKNGGNFSMSLAPVTCECDSNGWLMRRAGYSEFIDDKKRSRNFAFKDNVVRQASSGSLERNSFLFHNLVQRNDIVWIRFEELQLEDGRDSDFQVKPNPSDIPNKVYDMIGLVDRNPISYQAGSNDVSIIVTGRDLVKPLIDESLYFMNMPPKNESLADLQGIFQNDNPENFGRAVRGLISQQRSPITNFFEYVQPTLSNIVSFIFSSLAFVEICPDRVFSGYQFRINEDGTSSDVRSIYQAYLEKTNEVKTFVGAGIWSIIKVIIDQDSVGNRVSVDQSLATFEGSIFASLQKYIQEPFVELLSDTYGDQYFFTIRQPPFNKAGFYSLIKDELVVDIDESDVEGDTLDWYDGPIYSWYRLLPANMNQAGGYLTAEMATLYPVVYFRQYAELFGNRGYDVASNYLTVREDALIEKKNLVGNTQAKQFYEDLRFLIESTVYLPFTRQGTIVLNGRRKIKRGLYVRYKPTNEIFYVDAVSQSYNINMTQVDRKTVLSVSRGMVDKNINGVETLPLYFDLVDFKDKQEQVEKRQEQVMEYKRLPIYFDTDLDYPIVVDQKNLRSDDELDVDKRSAMFQEAEKALMELAGRLDLDSTLRVELIGYTDPDLSDEYNQRLSIRRAKNVKNRLLELVKDRASADSRITTTGKGEIKTSSDKSNLEPTVADKILDRRVDARITTTSNIAPKDQGAANNSINWKLKDNVLNFFLSRKQLCNNTLNVEVASNETSTPTELEFKHDPKHAVR